MVPSFLRSLHDVLADTFVALDALRCARFHVLREQDELEESYRLRGRVFGEKLGWIGLDQLGRDIDGYDAHALHLGVSLEGALVATTRVVPGHLPMMIDHEFSCLLTGGTISPGAGDAELTRLAIEPSAAGSAGTSKALHLAVRAVLLRGLVFTALCLGIERYLCVVTAPHYQLFASRMGFFRLPGPQRRMNPEHPECVAAAVHPAEIQRHGRGTVAWLSRFVKVLWLHPGLMDPAMARELDCAAEQWQELVTFEMPKEIERCA